MQPKYTGFVDSREWRWVLIVSSVLILMAFAPFLIYTLNGKAENMQFMGAIHDYQETAAHISKIVQGSRGELLASFLHTPDPHNATLFDVIYSGLGWISQYTFLEPIVIFHVARVGASLFMYMALYYLGAVIWSRQRTRRIFFLLVVLSAGLGWLATPLLSNTYLDVSGSVIFPFQASLMNVHYPLIIGLMALMVSLLIDALRPGSDDNPSPTNNGGTLIILSISLSLIYPQALLPIAVSFFTLTITHAFIQHKVVVRDLRWLLWFGVPALPFLVYYFVVLFYNPIIMQIWIQINTEPPPDVFSLLISLGAIVIIALPGLWRATRRFEPDGNQFMLGWFVAMLVLMYFSPHVQTFFAMGMMIPLAYFATRGVEDFWFQRITKMRYPLLISAMGFMLISNAFVLFNPISHGHIVEKEDVMMSHDYVAAFQFLAQQRNHPRMVVMSRPETSLWIPAWTGLTVVSGHPSQSLQPILRNLAINSWFNATDEDYDCQALLNGSSWVSKFRGNTPFVVHYVLYGENERNSGESVCLDYLTPIANFGTVSVYVVNHNTDTE